ncbi:MAG: hypothetical protein RL757_3049 [Bacteroidota bacterium]
MQDKLNNFEEQIRQRMQDFEPSSVPKPDFDALEARMEATAKADELEFDRIVRDAARRAQPNTVPKSHWEMMETQLDAAFTLRGKLMRYRVMELTLLALLGWSVANVVDGQQQDGKNAPTFETSKGNQEVQKVKKNNEKEENGNQKIDLQRFNLSPQNWRNRPADAVPQSANGKPIVQLDNGLMPSESQLPSQFSMQNNQFVQNNQPIADNQNVNISKENVTNIENTGGGAFSSVAATELLPTLEMPTLKADLRVLKPASPVVRIARPSRWSLAVAVAPSLDFSVSTLRDFGFQKTSADLTTNIGGGIYVSRQMNDRVSLETGVSYAAKSFRPTQASKISGGFDDYRFGKIDKVNMQVASIPLHANYLAHKSRRWALRAHVGTSLNAAVQTDYDVTLRNSNTSVTLTNPSFGNSSNLEKILPRNYSNAVEEEEKSNKYNLFSTLDFGVSADYKISRKWSIFAKPTWMQHIGKGIGVNADRLSSFILNIGTKADL